jgi:hypothetical protein
LRHGPKGESKKPHLTAQIKTIITCSITTLLFTATAACATPRENGSPSPTVANAPATSADTVQATPAPLSIEEARSGLSGVWIVTNFVNSTKPIDLRITKTLEGEEVPMRPWVREIYEKRIADARAGRIFADTESYCVASGMPRAMRGPNYPIQILQTSGQITILFEALHNMRFIYLDEELPPKEEVEPSLWGLSAGRWEGDTLVVKTIGLSDRTTLDKVGLPHSNELEVTERIRLTSQDTFENVITINDSKAFTRPWQIRATYKRMPRGTRIMEYECADNNRYKVNADGTLEQPKPN